MTLKIDPDTKTTRAEQDWKRVRLCLRHIGQMPLTDLEYVLAKLRDEIVPAARKPTESK